MEIECSSTRILRVEELQTTHAIHVIGDCVSAPTFDRATSQETKPSYALVTRQSLSSSKESTPPKSLQVWARENTTEYRGSRQNCEIIIEFMSAEGLSYDYVAQRDERLTLFSFFFWNFNHLLVIFLCNWNPDKATSLLPFLFSLGWYLHAWENFTTFLSIFPVLFLKQFQYIFAWQLPFTHCKFTGCVGSFRHIFELCVSPWAAIQKMEKEVQELEAEQKNHEDVRKWHNSKSKSPETSNEPSPRETDACSLSQVRRQKSHDSASQDCYGPGPTPGTPGKRQKSRSPSRQLANTVHFISGNPCVESVKGILHLYKDRWVYLRLHWQVHCADSKLSQQ